MAIDKFDSKVWLYTREPMNSEFIHEIKPDFVSSNAVTD